MSIVDVLVEFIMVCVLVPLLAVRTVFELKSSSNLLLCKFASANKRELVFVVTCVLILQPLCVCVRAFQWYMCFVRLRCVVWKYKSCGEMLRTTCDITTRLQCQVP